MLMLLSSLGGMCQMRKPFLYANPWQISGQVSIKKFLQFNNMLRDHFELYAPIKEWTGCQLMIDLATKLRYGKN